MSAKKATRSKAGSSESTGGGKAEAIKKWTGIVAGLLSLGTAIYGVVHAEANLRERTRVVNEQLANARLQEDAQDYPSAWDSLQRAGTTAEIDGLIGKLLGGLSKERSTVRTAQEDLAMQWIREARVSEGHKFSEICDKVIGTLSTGANESTGARKADLLAHQGWAYFLKERDNDFSVQPDVLYREGVAADPTNPYANVFWGHFILWNNGSLAEAKQHFAAALASNRARDEVRRFQLYALGNSSSDELDAEWWRAVDEMHKGGEAIDEHARSWMRFEYEMALNHKDDLDRLFAAVPPADLVGLQKMLLQDANQEESAKATEMAVMAIALEAAHQPDESLATWRELKELIHGNPNYAFVPRMNAAIKRLSAGTH